MKAYIGQYGWTYTGTDYRTILLHLCSGLSQGDTQPTTSGGVGWGAFSTSSSTYTYFFLIRPAKVEPITTGLARHASSTDPRVGSGLS